MHTEWRAAVAIGLVPQEVSAALKMGTIRTSDLPDIAAWWLAEGRDTPALRELGGAPRDDAGALDALWGQLCEELETPAFTEDEAARIDLRRIVAEWKAHLVSTSGALRAFESMSLHRFPDLDVPAGYLDEIDAGWGGPEDEMLADAEQRLTGLSDSLGNRPTWPQPR